MFRDEMPVSGNRHYLWWRLGSARDTGETRTLFLTPWVRA